MEEHRQHGVQTQEDRFKAAMREYENSAKQKYKTGVNVDDNHNVDQLWQVIDKAVDEYESKGQDGVWGKIRIGFRKLGDGSEAIQGWLGLLPTESHYLSVVCGGLKLILKVIEYPTPDPCTGNPVTPGGQEDYD